jgi:hypothetical protein
LIKKRKKISKILISGVMGKLGSGAGPGTAQKQCGSKIPVSSPQQQKKCFKNIR